MKASEARVDAPSEEGVEDVITCSKNKEEPPMAELPGSFRAAFREPEEEIKLKPKSRPIIQL